MAKHPELLSEVPFGAVLTYSPRGTSAVSRKSQNITVAIKRDQRTPFGYVARAAERTAESISKTEGLSDFLGPEVTLIPAPRSAPLVTGALWPGHRICEELIAHGLGKEILPCLLRKKAVNKAAFSAPGERPNAREHLESMAVESQLLSPAKLTIVDDVITKGSTLLAAATLVAEAFPDSEVRVFAVVRTMGLIPDVEKIIDPAVGRILRVGHDADRQP